MSLPTQFFQHPPAVATISQGGIQPNLARLDIKKLQNFFHTDWNMHPSGRFSLLKNLLHISLVLLRIQLFVFFLVLSGMGALVAYPAFMFLFHGDSLPFCRFFIVSWITPGCKSFSNDFKPNQKISPSLRFGIRS